MKRLFIVLLILALCFSVACSKTEPAETPTEPVDTPADKPEQTDTVSPYDQNDVSR